MALDSKIDLLKKAVSRHAMPHVPRPVNIDVRNPAPLTALAVLRREYGADAYMQEHIAYFMVTGNTLARLRTEAGYKWDAIIDLSLCGHRIIPCKLGWSPYPYPDDSGRPLTDDWVLVESKTSKHLCAIDISEAGAPVIGKRRVYPWHDEFPFGPQPGIRLSKTPLKRTKAPWNF